MEHKVIDVGEGNKLILLFDGGKIRVKKDGRTDIDHIMREGIEFYDHPIHGNNLGEYGLRYHSSWDWLIPAMAKAKDVIKEAGWGTPTEKQAWSILNAALNETFNLNIKNAHYCFVKFIQWHNQNSNK